MYQVGVNRNQLRVSQFFSVDTYPCWYTWANMTHLSWSASFGASRMPTFAMLYWDSEMFHRTTRISAGSWRARNTKGLPCASLTEMLFRPPGDFFQHGAYAQRSPSSTQRCSFRWTNGGRRGTTRNVTAVSRLLVTQAPHPARPSSGNICSLWPTYANASGRE